MSQTLHHPGRHGAAPGLVLDAGQYLALWRFLGLGTRHLLLDLPDHGRTYGERDHADTLAWRRLGEAGLLDARGLPDPSLADALSVLAAPAREVDVRVLVSGRTPHGVVAAARGTLGLVAERAPDGGVRLSPADPEDLPAALLARLPDRPALPGVAMAVPAHALGGPDVSIAERAHRLRRAGVPRHTIDRIAVLAERPPERMAQFGVAVRDGGGRRCRGPRVVGVADTSAGRCVISPDPSGTRLEIRPTDRPRLRAELAGLLAQHVRDVAPGP